MGRPWWRASLAAAVVLAAGLIGCAVRPVQVPGGPLTPDPQREAQREARVQQQARDALARWDTAVAAAGGDQTFVPTGGVWSDGAGTMGSWEPDVGGNNKAAVYAGMFVALITLPSEAPGPAEIGWPDGTTRDVRTISAAAALARMTAAGHHDCPACVPLQITSARLTTGEIQTTRGKATVPMWEFTLAGTAVRLTHYAIAMPDGGVRVTPPPWDSSNPPDGLSIESATVTRDGRQLTVTFTGSRFTRDERCGADYTATAMESATGVVVIVDEHANPAGGPCVAIGFMRTAVAHLVAALGNRTVLEVREGMPVPVTPSG